ncbi:MAG: DUF1214 domain-containing protein [Candidatus Binatia bacterium]|nr:DUF1214 domain-containing protein [Candidatus Binatia bacterium]
MATPQTDEAWKLFRKMLDDMAQMVDEDAECDLERLEGMRVLGRVTTMALELNLDVEADAPRLYSMDTPTRFVGGPNPDGEYFLSMIDATQAYRVRGQRGSSVYLGFQILAGIGLNPRRMGTNVPDKELEIRPDGTFALVFAATKPSDAELGGDPWVEIPDDSSALVVREYFADRSAETPAGLSIDRLEPASVPALPQDGSIAERFASAAFTIAKMITLHRTVKPEMLDHPNEFLTADGEELGSENTTPDNLYMIGSWRLAPDEALVLELSPPATRFWNVAIANVWHECIEPLRRRSSVTNAGAVARADGSVRVVMSATNPGAANWLDTGGRGRGFMVVRWLDNPSAPPVTTRVVPLEDAADR